MQKYKLLTALLSVVVSGVLFSACTLPGFRSIPAQEPVNSNNTPPVGTEMAQSAAPPSQTETALPPRSLTFCLANEPTSLFLYGDTSQTARTIRESIYDGPFDLVDYRYLPVILEASSSGQPGDVMFSPVTVDPGDLLITADGTLDNLIEGTRFYPSGCQNLDCVAVYSGPESVQVDQLQVRFRFLQGIRWSDGTSLTADDSVFSYEVAKALFPRARADVLIRTQSYQALDSYMVEWTGIPGERSAQTALYLFDPLPRHIWGDLAPEDLLTADLATRAPLGWGPYVIEAWTPGEKITLHRNPLYFRNAEGLPRFDNLVYRFLPNVDQALQALESGECDILDEGYRLAENDARLASLQEKGAIKLLFNLGTAWQQLTFGLMPYQEADSQSPMVFGAKEVRQAMTRCIDRLQIVNTLFGGEVGVLDQYIPSDHPLFNPQAARYPYDPPAGIAQLETLGWKDSDGDPATPRLAQGVEGIPEGSPLQVELLAASDEAGQRAAEIIRTSLNGCGVGVQIKLLPWQDLLAGGPEGPVFGRQFQLALFAWVSSLEPPCFLFTTGEIPGPYPQYPKAWGGANAGGFSNPTFDQQCGLALTSLGESPSYQAAHLQAQAIFADELPALPLYLQRQVVAVRSEVCGFALQPLARSAFWNLESLEYGEACSN